MLIIASPNNSTAL
jgi:hypothetical protein